jgi:hypothetical protein
LVQEFIPVRAGHINRAETLNGKFLYAINVYTSAKSFNLFPAEICAVPEKPVIEEIGEVCLTTAVKKGLKVEAFTPPAHIIHAVERLVAEANINVGGIEYLIDDERVMSFSTTSIPSPTSLQMHKMSLALILL